MLLTGRGLVDTIIWRLLRLSSPLFIGNLVNVSFHLVDVFWLGRLGGAFVASPTISWPFIMVFHNFGLGLASTSLAYVSQYVGARNRRSAGVFLGRFLVLVFLFSSAAAITGYLVAPLVYSFIGVPREAYGLAVIYSRVVFVGEPLVFLGYVLLMGIEATGDTRTSMLLGVMASLINLVLDPLLINGAYCLPSLGVAGAAIATVVSRSFIAVSGFIFFSRGFRGIRLVFEPPYIAKNWIVKVLRVGGPMGLQRSMNSLGYVAMMWILGFLGTGVIAAYGVAMRLMDLVSAFIWAFSSGLAILVGQSLGSGRGEKALQATVKAMLFIFTFTSLIAIILLILREKLVYLFISDSLIASEASLLILLYAPSIPFFALFFAGNGVARGSGRTVIMMLIGVARLWLFRVALAYALCLQLGFGDIGVWISMTASNIGAGILSALWVYRGKWYRSTIIEEEIRSVSNK